MTLRLMDRPWIAWLLAGAVLGQGIGLVLLGRLELRAAVQTLVVAAALGLLTWQAWRVRMRLNHRIDMLLVMGALGGLGMLAGWWTDLGFAAPPRDAGFHEAMGHGCGGGEGMAAGMGEGDGVAVVEGEDCCETGVSGSESGSEPGVGDNAGHGGGHGFWAMVGSWMTGLMLLAAVPPGLVLTRCAELARSGWRRWVSTHLVGNGLMVAGMVWLGHAIGPAVADLTGSSVVGGQIAMLLGMLVGMEAGMFFGEAVLGLKPWREWTWRETPARSLAP